MTSKPFVFDQDGDPDDPATREPRIVAEICARLVQWANTTSRSHVALQFAAIARGEVYLSASRMSPASLALRAEICERLDDWREIPGGPVRLSRWLNTLSAIYSTGAGGPAIFWLYIAFQTGDARQIAASFEERGDAKALPRQAAHQEFTQALATLRRLNRGLADALRELYERHCPEAAAAGGMVATGNNVVRPV